MDNELVFDVTLLNFIAASLIPLVTGLVTKAQASSRVKAICTLVLAVLTGAVAHMIANDGVSSWESLVSAMIATYVTAGVTYTNFWKPTGVAPAVAEMKPEVGIGTPVADPQAPARIDVAGGQVGGDVVTPAADMPGVAVTPDEENPETPPETPVV